jgi:hypothetical protein
MYIYSWQGVNGEGKAHSIVDTLPQQAVWEYCDGDQVIEDINEWSKTLPLLGINYLKVFYKTLDHLGNKGYVRTVVITRIA